MNDSIKDIKKDKTILNNGGNNNNETKRLNSALYGGNRKKLNKRMFIIGLILLVVIIAFLLFLDFNNGATPVEFTVLAEDQIPHEIKATVIPEYRDFERALACVVEDKVYVIVTRGEKPTSGFKIAIDSMDIEEDSQGKNVLSVYANFEDPNPGETLSQVLTYPLEVAETNLTALPDKIQLKAQYLN